MTKNVYISKVVFLENWEIFKKIWYIKYSVTKLYEIYEPSS